MPALQVPTYFKSDDVNINRRQDAEDKFFSALLEEPRAFIRDGVLVTVRVLVAPVTFRLNHGLGFTPHGFLVLDVVTGPAVVTSPGPPYRREGARIDSQVLDLFFTDNGTYKVLVF